MQAYTLLEDQRLIEARPQSGYYVRSRVPEIREPDLQSRSFSAPATVTISDLCQQVMRNMMNRDLLPLGSAVPSPQHLPVDKLNRIMASEMRRRGDQGMLYHMPPGYERLRVQIARRAIMAGISAGPDEVSDNLRLCRSGAAGLAGHLQSR